MPISNIAIVQYSYVPYDYIFDAAGATVVSCEVSDQLTGSITNTTQASNVQSCLCRVLEQRQIPIQHTNE